MTNLQILTAVYNFLSAWHEPLMLLVLVYILFYFWRNDLEMFNLKQGKLDKGSYFELAKKTDEVILTVQQIKDHFDLVEQKSHKLVKR